MPRTLPVGAGSGVGGKVLTVRSVRHGPCLHRGVGAGWGRGAWSWLTVTECMPRTLPPSGGGGRGGCFSRPCPLRTQRTPSCHSRPCALAGEWLCALPTAVSGAALLIRPPSGFLTTHPHATTSGRWLQPAPCMGVALRTHSCCLRHLTPSMSAALPPLLLFAALLPCRQASPRPPSGC